MNFSGIDPVPIILGVLGSIAKWWSDFEAGRAKIAWVNFIFIPAVGGFLGYMGASVAAAAGFPQWSNVLSGVFGALGSQGFVIVSQYLLRSRLP